MAFKNPNAIASVTREEFDELKSNVEKITSELEEVKNNISTKQVSNTLEKKDGYTLSNKEIKEARLGGTPRIDYFKLKEDKKEKQEMQELETVKNESNDILDQVNDLTSQMNEEPKTIVEPKIEPEKEENIDDFQSVIDISSIVNDNNTDNTDNKDYKLRNDIVINSANTSSGHRTYLISDDKINKMKSEYMTTQKTISA